MLFLCLKSHKGERGAWLVEQNRKRTLTHSIVEEMENNPNEVYCNVCSVVSKLTCSNCLASFYCSIEHQTQDWPTHKLLCKLVRSDADIRAAVKMWCTNPTKALKKYGHIREWNTSKVTTMKNLFREKNNFNEDISRWDVSSVTNMRFMFRETPFNGDISGWNVSSVTNMSYMFFLSSFNGNISRWYVSSVTDMCFMFVETPFNGDISGWNVSKVDNMCVMFRGTLFNGDISGWDVSSVTVTFAMFSQTPFNGDISGWNVSSVTSMRYMFYQCSMPSNHKPRRAR